MAETAPTPTPSTDERLITACLELIGEAGFVAATTRAIAERAGVNEVTLFRRFSTKADLVSAALATATEPIRTMAAEPTEDLTEDLVRLAEVYGGFVSRWPKVAGRILAEVAAHSEIGETAGVLIGDTAGAVRTLMVHHINGGGLATDDPTELTLDFLGPLLVSAALGAAVSPDGTPPPMDGPEHVRRFLDGHRA